MKFCIFAKYYKQLYYWLLNIGLPTPLGEKKPQRQILNSKKDKKVEIAIPNS